MSNKTYLIAILLILAVGLIVAYLYSDLDQIGINEAEQIVLELPEVRDFIKINAGYGQKIGFEVGEVESKPDVWLVEGYSDNISNRNRWNTYHVNKQTGEIVWSWIKYDNTGEFICYQKEFISECDPNYIIKQY